MNTISSPMAPLYFFKFKSASLFLLTNPSNKVCIYKVYVYFCLGICLCIQIIFM